MRAGDLPHEGAKESGRARRPFHPFLIALFPALSLYSHNIYETSPGELAAPIAAALGGALAVWLVLILLSRDARRAALATSTIVAACYVFDSFSRNVVGAVNTLGDYWVKRDYHVHPLVLLAMLAIPAGVVVLAIFRRLKDPRPLTAFMNTFALILVALPSIHIVVARMKEPAKPLLDVGAKVATHADPKRLPDIYYIILDGYARSDVLKEHFNIDNTPFLDRLERKGFFVARRSTSNYCQTWLSLCSSLNANYLDKLVAPSSHDVTPLSRLIGENLVISSLRPLGYKFVTYATGYGPTEAPDADYNFRPRHPSRSFHRMLLGMTPFRLLVTDPGYWNTFANSRVQTLYILDHLPEVAAIEAPTFAFAHIICPHPPFVFGEDGQDVSPSTYGKVETGPRQYREGYRRQVIYVTKRVEQTIDRILASSPAPPIIILQSDHGSGLLHDGDDLEKTDVRERMGILNCYYFPDGKYERLGDRITPVNSFRVVLDQFFGANLLPLEERNYFSPYSDPLELTDITGRLSRASQDTE